jgi:kumamolisin
MAILQKSSVVQRPDIISVSPSASTDCLTATIFINRPDDLSSCADNIIQKNHPILTHDQFYTRFGALDEHVQMVSAFVVGSNLTVIDKNHGSATIKVSGAVVDFNNAFNIQILDVVSPNKTYKTYHGELTIPDNLVGIIQFVIGLDTSAGLKSCANLITPQTSLNPQAITNLTPQQVANAYNFPVSSGNGGCIGIVEFGGGYTNANITSTFSNLGLTPPTITTVSVNGAVNSPDNSGASSENMLDITVIGGIVPLAKLVVYFAPNSNADFINCFNAVIHDTINYPSVVSVSWASDESFWGSYATALDSVLQSAVVLGITFCISSGDYGSEAYVSGSSVYSVNYPSSSPYVLAVGGTTLQLNNGNIASEIVWNQSSAGSGGGVSLLYSVPSWQTNLTFTKYPTGNATALTGRGVPDVAANADPQSGYQFYYGTSNTFVQSGGTSAAAPLMAALILQLNILTGRRIGFANTLFYANTTVFNDITSGNNADPTSQGYVATVGWDACTGLGSPIGTAIYKLLHVGNTYPKQDYGFRISGQTYPRLTSIRNK